METRKFIGNAIQINEALQELVAEIDRLSQPGGTIKLAGIETGFGDLDDRISGLRPGSLTVIASRPALGKTTLALNIASHIAFKVGQPVLIYSLGRSNFMLANALVSHVGKIESWKLRTGQLDEKDRILLNATLSSIKDAPLYIDEASGLSVEEIVNKTSDFILKHGHVGLIVIDDLQAIIPIDNPMNDYSKVMSTLNKLARETDTAIILTSQLNRKLETRRNKRPRICDLPAHSIEQYADLLMFLYRDEVYDPDSDDRGLAEVIIGRNRYGPLGPLLLGSNQLNCCSFTERTTSLPNA